MSPRKNKESSSNRDSNDQSVVPSDNVSRIISVNDLTIDRGTAHSGSELMRSSDMLPHFAAEISPSKFQNDDTVSWTDETLIRKRSMNENINKSAH